MGAVKNAEDMRITSAGTYAGPIDNLEYDENEMHVGAMSVWRISDVEKTIDGTRVFTFQVYMGLATRKSAFKYAQNAQVQIILSMRKISSWAHLFKASFA